MSKKLAAHNMADLVAEQEAELDALKADIETYIRIANEQAARIAELEAEVACLLRIDQNKVANNG